MDRCSVLFYIFYFVCFESINASLSSSENRTAVNSEIKVLTGDISRSKKLRLNVYYETLCPASRWYLTTQVEFVIDKLWPYVDVHMIPYGHAQTIRSRGSYKFNCQHGPKECYGNKLQACAIEIIRNNTLATHFNICLMKYFNAYENYNNDTPLFWCAYKHHVSVRGMKNCADTRRGAALLKKYGDETHRLRPPFVPYVTFDNSTESVEGNLFVKICQILKPTPPNCPYTTIMNYNRLNYRDKKYYNGFSPTKLLHYHAR